MLTSWTDLISLWKVLPSYSLNTNQPWSIILFRWWAIWLGNECSLLPVTSRLVHKLPFIFLDAIRDVRLTFLISCRVSLRYKFEFFFSPRQRNYTKPAILLGSRWRDLYYGIWCVFNEIRGKYCGRWNISAVKFLRQHICSVTAVLMYVLAIECFILHS